MEFGEGGDPRDGFGVDGMESEPEGGPKGERGSADGRDKKVDEDDHHGVEEDVN